MENHDLSIRKYYRSLSSLRQGVVVEFCWERGISNTTFYNWRFNEWHGCVFDSAMKVFDEKNRCFKKRYVERP